VVTHEPYIYEGGDHPHAVPVSEEEGGATGG